ncbi:hypothetical protein D3C73_1394580 [compost metagenome]
MRRDLGLDETSDLIAEHLVILAEDLAHFELRLAVGEACGTLFKHGRHGFCMIGGVVRQRLVCSGQFQQGAEAHVLPLVKQPFGEAQGMTGIAGDAVRQGHGGFHQRVRRRQLGHQGPVQRSLGV